MILAFEVALVASVEIAQAGKFAAVVLPVHNFHTERIALAQGPTLNTLIDGLGCSSEPAVHHSAIKFLDKLLEHFHLSPKGLIADSVACLNA
jgi:hypothetical protein